MYITAYYGIIDSDTAKLPIHESIQSIYPHIDEIVVVDASKYDKIDLSRYGKVRRHLRTVFNPYDNPFGSLFTQALRCCNSDYILWMDSDEIFEFKSSNLKDIIKMYPLDGGAGIAFSLLNYYCSRHFKIDGCSSKGPHLFKNSRNLFHDLLQGYWIPHSPIRRTNIEADRNDGVRLCDQNGQPMAHYKPIPLEEVTVHHTSHLDPLSKMVRSVTQFNHTSTIDVLDFSPYDMRLNPAAAARIYELGEQKIKDKSLVLWGNPIPHEYEKNELLERYIERCHITEFDPTGFKVEA